MTSKAQQKKETHQRMVEAVHTGFRQHGYDGAGVDGLASEAGVTSGAFYAHFGSKSGAFREAIHEGLSQVKIALSNLQEQHGENWLVEFNEFYLGERRCEDLSNSCAMQSLTPEVMRSDEKTQAIFESDMLDIIEQFSEGLLGENSDNNKEKAWATISMLIGGVTLARAVKNPQLADDIANAVKKTLNNHK